MADYTIEIDLSGGNDPNGYFVIDVVSMSELHSEYLDNNPRVERFGIGEIRVKNYPYKYAKLGGDKYNLYDIISSISPSQEMHLRFTSEHEIRHSYFGVIDCRLDRNKGVITIKSYILDQYTDLLENLETEVSLYERSNQVRNGTFLYWKNGEPEGWTQNDEQYLQYEKTLFGDSSAIAIYDYDYDIFHPQLPDERIYLRQTIPNVLKDSQVQISFDFLLTGKTTEKKDLFCGVEILNSEGGVISTLSSEGKWVDPFFALRIKYRGGNVAVDITSASQFNQYNITTDKMPAGGNLRLTFYRPKGVADIFDRNYKLILSNIIVSTPSIALKTIKIPITSSNIVTNNEDSKAIYWSKRKSIANFQSDDFHEDSTTLDSFFNEDGSPIESMLKMRDDNKIQLKDVIEFFKSPISISHKYELSRITVFKCERKWAFRKYRAVCEFSREEIYLPDSDVSLEGTEWVKTGIRLNESDLILWVRTPFNGAELPWVKSPMSFIPNKWSVYKNRFSYQASITSTKQYLSQSGVSKEIRNAIDLRDLFTKVYNETHLSLRGKSVFSNFIWNDPLSEEEEELVYLGNDNSTNYVTMTDKLGDEDIRNELNNTMVIHTNEFSTNPSSDSDNTILKMSFGDLMEGFMVLFPQCYYFIDDDRNLHIEHVKYFDRVNSAYDITGSTFDYLGEYESWEYLKEKLYSLEQYEFKNSSGIDFFKSEVSFDKIVTNKRGKEIKNKISGTIISTDLKHCIENGDNLDNGIVLVSYNIVGEQNITSIGEGQKTRSSILNGDLSIASLLAKYATYEGTWKEGKINGWGFWGANDTYQFTTTKPVIKGEQISIKGVFLHQNILSKLGIGIVSQRMIDYDTDITRIVALYRHPELILSVTDDDIFDYGEGLPVEVTIPEVLTVFPAQVELDSIVQCSGIITSMGNGVITQCGIIISLEYAHMNIGLGQEYISPINPTDSTPFSILLEELEPLTWYYYRAFAFNSAGIAYGAIHQFRTTEPYWT